ncbi:MAG: hypothetical protein V2A65_11565 [Candidatus Omnitrophota bacterium]
MRKGMVFLLGLVLLVAVPLPVRGQEGGQFSQEQIDQAAEKIEQSVSGNAQVNWTKGYIQATGEGYPAKWARDEARKLGSAKEAAKGVAQRNLLEAIKGVVIDSETTIENQEIAYDLIKKQVKGILRGSSIVEDLTSVEEFADGSMKVSVTVRMPIYGNGRLADIVQPSAGSGLPSNVRPYRQRPENPFDAAVVPEEVKKPLSEVYTGLIIDTQGLEVRPAIAPQILAENGMEIYGTVFVNRDYAISQGIVGYAKSLAFARKMDRVADRPLVVKALKTSGDLKTDVIISLEDAYKIEKLKERQTFLHQCRVVFLVD